MYSMLSRYPDKQNGRVNEGCTHVTFIYVSGRRVVLVKVLELRSMTRQIMNSIRVSPGLL